MHWVVLANDSQREEFVSGELAHDIKIDWIKSPKEFMNHNADAYFDLDFEPVAERVKLLSPLPTNKLIINSVIHTVEKIGLPVTRINAWPGFLKSKTIEVSGKQNSSLNKIESVWGRRFEWLPDTPGFVSARVIAMIINEAYMVLEQDISSKEDIDTAMKLGTNYPFGPFEWGSKIGLKNVQQLLSELSKSQARFTPCSLLIQEANRS